MAQGNFNSRSTIDEHPLLISPEVDTQSLRACSMLSIMMSNSLLGNNGTPKEAQQVSSPVDSIDIFLSHSWSANGLWKLVALSMFFNSSVASEMVTWSYLGVLVYFSFVSTTALHIMGVVIVHVIFLTGLCIISQVINRNTTMFFDKCCINQLDPLLRSEGISRLSDYVRASKRLVILWSPDYLDRMWCVYELALFLHTHSEGDITVINLSYTEICTISALLQFSFTSCLALLDMSVLNNGVVYTGLKGLLVPLICLEIWYLKVLCDEEFEKMRVKVRSFGLSRAKCSRRTHTRNLKNLIIEMYGSAKTFEEKLKVLVSGGTEPRGIQRLLSTASQQLTNVIYMYLIVSTVFYISLSI